MTRWEDLQEWERLARKLADAGPTDEEARAWVLEVLDIARADERERHAVLREQLAYEQRAHLAHDNEMADLRAKVEALPTPRMVDDAFMMDERWDLWRIKVLALLEDKSSDG